MKIFCTMFPVEGGFRERILRALEDIERLPNDWNNNGAPSFEKEHVQRVRTLVDSLAHTSFVAPSACRSISIEYDAKQLGHLLFDVCADGTIEMFYVGVSNHTVERTAQVSDIQLMVERYFDGQL